jgi:hypothetical protein
LDEWNRMRTDLWELFERFSRHEIEILTQAYPRDAAGQLPGLDTEPATFHQLCVGLAMYRNEFPLVNLPASMTDGLGDFSLDAIALMLGPDPVSPPTRPMSCSTPPRTGRCAYFSCRPSGGRKSTRRR